MKSNRKTLSVILFILAGICILAAIILFVRGHMEDRHMEESLDALRPTESPAETVPSSEPETIATATTESAAEEAVPAPEEVTRVPNPYADSFLANEDMGAWLQIPGTGIDYPVMWTPRDESYYLYRAFDGSENKNGCLILDTDSCLDPLSTNLIIHGQVFKFYKFFQADTQEEFDDFYNNIKQLSQYDTGVTAQFGDHFLTLSTCVYHVEQGRFVVVAKETEPGDHYLPIQE